MQFATFFCCSKHFQCQHNLFAIRPHFKHISKTFSPNLNGFFMCLFFYLNIFLGAQWGDEGKGKVVDMLATDADVVCRCQVRTFSIIIHTHQISDLFYLRLNSANIRWIGIWEMEKSIWFMCSKHFSFTINRKEKNPFRMFQNLTSVALAKSQQKHSHMFG